MKPTAQDFQQLTARMQMDLRAAEAKLVQLRAWLAALDLPTEEKQFNPETALAFVRQVGWQYTDSSLADELWAQGADRDFVDRALHVAAEVRREREPEEAPAVES